MIFFGLALAAVGALLTIAPRLPWLGRLPGDFSYESERLRVYVPLGTSVLLSLVLSLVLYLIRR